MRIETLEAEVRASEARAAAAETARRELEVHNARLVADLGGRAPGTSRPAPAAPKVSTKLLIWGFGATGAGALYLTEATFAPAGLPVEPPRRSAPSSPVPEAPSEVPLASAIPAANETSKPDAPADAVDAQYGQIDANSIPHSRVVIDGRPRGGTPVAGVKVSPGEHTVVFIHSELGTMSRTVTVEAGRTATVVVRFPSR